MDSYQELFSNCYMIVSFPILYLSFNVTVQNLRDVCCTFSSLWPSYCYCALAVYCLIKFVDTFHVYLSIYDSFGRAAISPDYVISSGRIVNKWWTGNLLLQAVKSYPKRTPAVAWSNRRKRRRISVTEVGFSGWFWILAPSRHCQKLYRLSQNEQILSLFLSHVQRSLRMCGCKPTYRSFATRVSQHKIWHFWVIGIERNVWRCTFNRYSVIRQFAKLAAGEQLCRRCTHRKL